MNAEQHESHGTITPSVDPIVAADDPRVAEALEEYLAAVESGRRPDRAEFLARHAEIAAELASCLRGVEMLRDAAPHFDVPIADGAGGPPARLGDFRLVRQVGRGGMGVVYEAEQVSLGRRVALKTLPTAVDPRQLQRFQVEAQAAAHLHHPHIVPVFAVGADQGIHYFAMQFIDGRTLAAVIRELRQNGPDGFVLADPSPSTTAAPATIDAPAAGSLPDTEPASTPSSPGAAHFRRVADWGVQAAEALEHAHGLGVLHRDVKPANLMVDARDHLWVTDFGLARIQGDSQLTATGDLLGTLRYMSPEQALAKRVVVDHRTDVYSLGATLYELLTLRPVFSGRDRQELLRQIAFDDPTPPRRLEPRLPRDLETIVLKALAKEAEGRYATAGELADDLRRFLADQPILARRPSPWERALRWSRRHRPLIGAAAAVLVLACAGLAAGTVLLWREQVRTEQEKARTDEHFAMALVTLEHFYRYLGESEDSAFDPESQRKIKDLMRSSLGLYEKLTRQVPVGTKARWETAHAHHRAGSIYERLGQVEKARGAYQASHDLLGPLVAESPRNVPYREELIEVLQHLSSLDQRADRFGAAEPRERRALALARALVAEFPGARGHRLTLGESLRSLADVLQGLQDYHDQERVLGEAIEVLKPLVDQSPDTIEYRRALALAYYGLGNLKRMTMQPIVAEPLLDLAVEEARKMLELAPLDPRAREMIAQTYSVLCCPLIAPPHLKPEKAEKHYNRALTAYLGLANDYPRNTRFAESLAYAHLPLISILSMRNRNQEAVAKQEEAVTIWRRLVAEHPDLPRYRIQLASGLTLLARLQPDRSAANETQAEAVTIWEALTRAHPDDPNHRVQWASALLQLAPLHRSQNRPEEAEATRRQALSLIEKLETGPPARSRNRAELIRTLVQLARDWQYDGQAEVALLVLRKAAAIGPDQPHLGNDLAWALVTCPGARPEDVERAIAMSEKSLAARPKEGAYWNTLGVARLRAGRWAEAIKALETSMQLRGGGDPDDWFPLATALHHAGRPDEARRWYDKGDDWLRSKSAFSPETHQFRVEAVSVLGLSTEAPGLSRSQTAANSETSRRDPAKVGPKDEE